jgi:hypothetical protein
MVLGALLCVLPGALPEASLGRDTRGHRSDDSPCGRCGENVARHGGGPASVQARNSGGVKFFGWHVGPVGACGHDAVAAPGGLCF